MFSDRARRYTEAMDALAREEFGDAYTLTPTYWNDGDFRVVAYRVVATEYPEKRFEELWYQDSQFDHERVLFVRTASADADVPRTDTRQHQIGPSEWREFPADALAVADGGDTE